MKWTDLDENWCPIARTLSVVGDRWTMLILRDCFQGLSRFDQFVQSTGATRHVVAGRLKRLVEADILDKRPQATGLKRCEYVLTDKGKELEPALRVLFDWGKKHLPIRRPTKT